MSLSSACYSGASRYCRDEPGLDADQRRRCFALLTPQIVAATETLLKQLPAKPGLPDRHSRIWDSVIERDWSNQPVHCQDHYKSIGSEACEAFSKATHFITLLQLYQMAAAAE